MIICLLWKEKGEQLSPESLDPIINQRWRDRVLLSKVNCRKHLPLFLDSHVEAAMRCRYSAEMLDCRLIVDRPGSLKATRTPYLLFRDEISPKRDRPCFEGSQEALSRTRKAERHEDPGRPRCEIVKSRMPLLTILFPPFCPPAAGWLMIAAARPIFRLNSCEPYTRPSSPRNSTARGRGARANI